MTGFGDIVGTWAKETESRFEAVFQRAVILLAQELVKTGTDGGTLPHLTGNLMRSLLAQVGSMPLQGEGDQKYSGSDVGAVVAQAMIGSEIYLGFQAVYARRMNYGFVGEDALGRTYNQSGRHFVERAIALWPQCVRQAVEDVKNGVGV